MSEGNSVLNISSNLMRSSSEENVPVPGGEDLDIRSNNSNFSSFRFCFSCCCCGGDGMNWFKNDDMDVVLSVLSV